MAGTVQHVAPAALARSPLGARVLSRGVSTVRTHRLLVALLAVAAVLRGIVWVAYQPALEFYGDSFTYLGNAAHLHPRLDRPMGYPLVLRVLMIPGLATVTLVQHLIGLGLGVLVYALLRRWRAPKWAAALGAAPVLFDGYQLDIEQFIMSEPLFELLVLGAVALVVLPRRLTGRVCAVAGAVLAYAALTRTLALLLAVPFVGYLLLRRVGGRRLAAFLLALMLPVLAYTTWFKVTRGRFAIVGYDGLFLYGRVAPIARCEVVKPPEPLRPLCESTPVAYRLGPDFYDWSSASPRFLLPNPRGISTYAELGDFARRVILAQPGDYARMVAGDVLHYFAPVRYAGPRDWFLQTWQFPGRDPRARYLWHVTLAVAGHNGTKPVHHHRVEALATFLRGYQRVVYTPGPVLAAGLVVGLAGAAAGRRGDRRREVAALLAVTGLAILVAPAATADFDYRYSLPALPLLPAAGVLGAQLLLARRSPYPARPPLPPYAVDGAPTSPAARAPEPSHVVD